MPRLTAKAFPQELPDYYNYCTHREISRREFLNLAAKYAVGGVTALAPFDLLKPNYTLAIQVEFTDPETTTEYITYPSPSGHDEVRGYLAKPAKMGGKTPAVVVVHENRGLNLCTEDVTRRVVKEGYVALAPNDLGLIGGYPGNDGKGRELQQWADPTRLMNDFFAAIEFTQRYPQTTGKVYISEFCYGGGVSSAAAIAYPELARAVPFCGHQAPIAGATKIEAPLLLHYAELDNRINEGWSAYEAALKANNKIYEAYMYPGVNHGFHNDFAPRYGKSAADFVWQRVLRRFDKYLS